MQERGGSPGLTQSRLFTALPAALGGQSPRETPSGGRGLGAPLPAGNTLLPRPGPAAPALRPPAGAHRDLAHSCRRRYAARPTYGPAPTATPSGGPQRGAVALRAEGGGPFKVGREISCPCTAAGLRDALGRGGFPGSSGSPGPSGASSSPLVGLPLSPGFGFPPRCPVPRSAPLSSSRGSGAGTWRLGPVPGLVTKPQPVASFNSYFCLYF